MKSEDKFYPVKGFDGYYEINESGLIRSVNRLIKRCTGAEQWTKGQLLTPYINNRGYSVVRLHSNLVKNKHMLVHRLVAINFIVNLDPALDEINHLDGNKLNNHKSNLEWSDRSKNNLHRYQTLQKLSKIRKLSAEDALFIFLNFKERDKEFGQKPLALRFGVTKTVIYKIVNKISYREIHNI